jgi:hypothetical protein
MTSSHRSNPDALAALAREAVRQPPVAVEMGWLFVALAAFVLIHVIAGTLGSRAYANETTDSGLPVTSSLYD